MENPRGWLLPYSWYPAQLAVMSWWREAVDTLVQRPAGWHALICKNRLDFQLSIIPCPGFSGFLFSAAAPRLGELSPPAFLIVPRGPAAMPYSSQSSDSEAEVVKVPVRAAHKRVVKPPAAPVLEVPHANFKKSSQQLKAESTRAAEMQRQDAEAALLRMCFERHELPKVNGGMI